MPVFFRFFKRIIQALNRQMILKVLLAIFAVMLLGGLGLTLFEKEMTFANALWWAIVTVTTVGYGDISPATPGGRLVGISVMMTGIGLLGTLTASIASLLVERQFLENRGMKATNVSDHLIICGWNFRGPRIVEDFRQDPKSRGMPIVVIADLPEKPLDEENFHFIRGDVSTENLEKAAIGAARVVIVLSDDKLDAYSRDAKTILNTLAIESANPDVYTCVELMDEANVGHCRRAKADEIIVVGELSTNLLVQAALDHGMTRMISELVSNRYGEDLYKIEVPRAMIGKTFYDALCELKATHGILCVGVGDRDGRRFAANPKNETVLSEEDWLFVIATERPDISDV